MRRRDFAVGLAGSLLAAPVSGGATRARESQPARIRGVPGPYRVIDVHAHTLNTRAPDPSGAARKYFGFDGTVERLIRAMDESGVDRAFLLTYNAEDLGAEIRHRKFNPVDLKQACNRQYHIEAWRAHRERFWLFVNHSNALRESFLEDLERDFEQGAVGWKYMPIFYGFLADNPGFLPAFERCRKRRAPVILDLSNWHIGQYSLHNEVPERQNLVKSFADYGRLLDPLFTEFKTVPICLAHMGTPGGWDHKTMDWSKDKAERDYEAVFEFVNRHPNALVDTSPNMAKTPEAYAKIVKAVGARKVMWGTDWPFASMNSWRVVQDQCPFLSGAEKALIFSGNAVRFVQGEV